MRPRRLRGERSREHPQAAAQPSPAPLPGAPQGHHQPTCLDPALLGGDRQRLSCKANTGSGRWRGAPQTSPSHVPPGTVLSPPRRSHQHLPSQATCAHTPALASGHGVAVTQLRKGQAGHPRCEREGGIRVGVWVTLTPFASDHHLQLQARVPVVVNGLGCKGGGGLSDGEPSRDPPNPTADPRGTHRYNSSCAPP